MNKKRAAFSLLEMILVLFFISIIAMYALPKSDRGLKLASSFVLEHISYTRHLALNDSQSYTNLNQTRWFVNEFPSINPQGLIDENPMWQIQFHLDGTYALFSYSIYIDTPRYSVSTHYDGRPRAGDIIATQGTDRKCLSGYSSITTSSDCKNNTSIFVRLQEAYGIDDVTLQTDIFCQERLQKGARIYFDKFGKPYCGSKRYAIKIPFKIILHKRGAKAVICVMPTTGYAFIAKNGQCV